MAHVGQTFESIDEFYDDHEPRRMSGECDYGVWWVEHRAGPKWRVSHVIETDETYAICCGGWGAPSRGHVEIVAVGLTYEEVEKAMNGSTYPDCEWTLHCGHQDTAGLGWVRKRLRETMQAKGVLRSPPTQ